MKNASEVIEVPRTRGAGAVVDFLVWAALLSLTAFFLTGCVSMPKQEMLLGKGYEPANVHRAEPRLPEQVRRVAVLPMTVEEQLGDLESQRDTLSDTLRMELSRTKKFELLIVSREQMQILTGRHAWTAEEPLPARFFDILREQLGCDAVLFNRVTAFRAYPPLALGWNLKLMDSQTARVYWALDEVFDAGDERVVNGARRYQSERQTPNPVLADSRTILSSPLRFGQYAAATSVATLPAR